MSEQLYLWGPPVVEAQAPDGAGWLAVRDYGHRQEGLREGTGSFVTFQSTNEDGKWFDWVLLNGGLISREPGAEQGDLDLLVMVDGRLGGFAIVGDMTKFGGPDAGLLPIESGRMNLGSPWQRMNMVFCKMLVVESVGKQVQINGVWQWRDCIPVKTQAGMRWMPVYEAYEGA